MNQPKKQILVFIDNIVDLSTIAQYVDLGLPSGTLWKATTEDGFYTYSNAVAKFDKGLPTKAQIEELEKYCVWERGWSYETSKGCTDTGKNGNQIFFPASGYRDRNTRQLHSEGMVLGYGLLHVRAR